MKIRLTVDVAVDTKDHAQLIYDAIKDHIDWFGFVHPELPYFIAFHLCEHDDIPNNPCKIWEEWRNGRVTWHNGEPVP